MLFSISFYIGYKMAIPLRIRLENLISSDTSLPSIAEELRQMKNEGFQQEVVRKTLEELRKEYKNESDEDRILEILDLVTGFCSPEKRVWDS